MTAKPECYITVRATSQSGYVAVQDVPPEVLTPILEKATAATAQWATVRGNTVSVRKPSGANIGGGALREKLAWMVADIKADVKTALTTAGFKVRPG